MIQNQIEIPVSRRYVTTCHHDIFSIKEDYGGICKKQVFNSFFLQQHHCFGIVVSAQMYPLHLKIKVQLRGNSYPVIERQNCRFCAERKSQQTKIPVLFSRDFFIFILLFHLSLLRQRRLLIQRDYSCHPSQSLSL